MRIGNSRFGNSRFGLSNKFTEKEIQHLACPILKVEEMGVMNNIKNYERLCEEMRLEFSYKVF